MIRRGGWREGGTNNRSQLCKSQLQLRDVLKKGKKERKEDRREDEVRSLIQFVDEGRIRKVMGEKSRRLRDRQCNRIIRTGIDYRF